MDEQSIRLYAMSTARLNKRKSYYEKLEHTQKSDSDITDWLVWFLDYGAANRAGDRAIEKGRLYGIMLEGHWITVGTPDAIAPAEVAVTRAMRR